jgi:hypothetical protein
LFYLGLPVVAEITADVGFVALLYGIILMLIGERGQKEGTS